MKQKLQFNIRSVSILHELQGLPKPCHPLISLIEQHQYKPFDVRITFGLYAVLLSRHTRSKIKYGQEYYNFEAGILSTIAPGQILNLEAAEEKTGGGWMLVFHPDFIRTHPLGTKIKEYGFFSYDLSHALRLSEQEEGMLTGIMKTIEAEYKSVNDQHSPALMIAYLEVLLHYTNRYYVRQISPAKKAGSNLLKKIDDLVLAYLQESRPVSDGLPTVNYVARKLNLSPHYLSDLLKEETGNTARQLIHNIIIEYAKNILADQRLSISEISYQLGFQHIQSFNKLFKAKTGQTPKAYRQSLS